MITRKPAGLTTAIPALTAGFGMLCGTAFFTARLRHLQSELDSARRIAERDALTGLLNRTGLERCYERLATSGARPAMALIDLDGFKSVNDTWGHQAGDALLTTVASRLTAACAGGGAVPGRLAGDEFLLLIPHTHSDAARWTTLAVLSMLSSPAMLPAGEKEASILITASAGIATPEPRGRSTSWRSQLHRADIALYHAKVRRGRAVAHTADMTHPCSEARSGGLPVQLVS